VNFGLDGRVAIVTGASRGLGAQAAIALVDEGARVLAVARSADALAELAASRPGQIVAEPCDMRDREKLVELPRLARERLGRLDVVVNNAGIAPAGHFLEMTPEALDEVLDVNLVAPALLSRAAAISFIDQGHRGSIVNVASISGIRGKATLAAYSASKGGLIQLTRALAAEWARHDIQVNAIAPGGFVTEAQQHVLADAAILKRRIQKIPARRLADPEEIGPVVCMLASTASRFITGSVIVIDGGETAKI